MTGEEHEVTVFKNHARVFVYDKDGGQWKERGRGVLKLNKTEQNNDSDPPRKKGARLIMRTEGTFIVVLNIPVYRGMNAGGPQGGPPTGNTVSFMGQEASGKLQQITIRVRPWIMFARHQLIGHSLRPAILLRSCMTMFQMSMKSYMETTNALLPPPLSKGPF